MIFGQKISAVLSKVHSSCPAEGFERGLSLFQKFLILHHFRVLAESFRTFVEIISAALSILRFTSPAGTFELRTLLKFKFFYPFPISAINFVKIVTTGIQRVENKNLKQVFFEKFILLFQHFWLKDKNFD